GGARGTRAGFGCRLGGPGRRARERLTAARGTRPHGLHDQPVQPRSAGPARRRADCGRVLATVLGGWVRDRYRGTARDPFADLVPRARDRALDAAATMAPSDPRIPRDPDGPASADRLRIRRARRR